MDFEIIFYTNSSGRNIIEEFILELNKSNQRLVAKTRQAIDKLRNRFYHKEPLSKHLEPGLWELKVNSGTDILRTIYTFDKGKVIILLHIFISEACELTLFKKQQKTPTGDLEIARKRLKEIKGEKPL